MTILATMASTQRSVIVGGGVLGTMHAVAARRRGFEVVHLEREAEARGASVRNFGLVWVSGRKAGPELALALRARELWAELGARVSGLGFRAAGSLTLATKDAELALLKEAAALPDADRRGFELLDPTAVRVVNPALRGEFAGGLLCRADAIVEPRQVLPALRSYLAGGGEGTGGYTWLPGREVTEIVPNAVRDHTGAWHRGDLVILCPGAAHTGVAGAVPGPRRGAAGPAADDADGAAGRADHHGAGRRRLAALLPRLRPAGAGPAAAAGRRGRAGPRQLLLVQRADGGLTIGDTHEYAEPFAFDVDEDAYGHLRARAEALLGGSIPRVRKRWAGVYSEVDPGMAADALYHRAEVEPGVVLVTGPGGRGMTCSPAIAEETFR